ncbi:DUF3667 domain-containing protein [Hymenobacter sp. 5317J-9]|uniref:DUF3667 domain-containing protein n=1 Tax=Hymenobacter sp. 5317J-9 TaxID=2932250 RepID=UPI001FD70399|nr:DUF3667 domain-containing protein [Hymenobacter sp. 5317J-9]UOQ99101.1 DUF3667 domain-containing protein [Hymenobacter sp. 5317J-9]
METLPSALAPTLAVPVPSTPDTPVCASCHTPLAGAYCHNCGEKRLHRHDYALKHFLEHTVDTVTHFDLRVLRDLWLQLRRPGFLAAEWLQGRRVAHAPPVQLFLVTNLLFYLAASASHFSAFETKLKYHFGGNNLYGAFANRLVQQHVQKTGTTLAAFAEHFNGLAHVYSKSLVFLFIPLLAAPLWLFFFRQRRYFVEWIMLSTYLFAGMLLVYAAMALAMLGLFLMHLLPPSFNQDGFYTLLMVTLTATYIALFFKGAFPGQSWPLRWGKALALTFCFALALLIPYRFVLFLVCYWAAQ